MKLAIVISGASGVALGMRLRERFDPKPHTLEPLTDSFVGRILKMLQMEHTPYHRWREVDSTSWT